MIRIHLRWSLVVFILLTTICGTFSAGQSIPIQNASFEANNPGGAGAITGWTASSTKFSGIALSNAAYDDYNQVAFCGGATLQQLVSGLDTTLVYELQWQGTTDVATTPMAVSYGNQGGLGAGNGGNPSRFQYITAFIPNVSSAQLKLAGGNATSMFQFDAVSLRVLPQNEVAVLFNPSFEGSDSAAPDGSSSKIAGWKSAGTTGVNPNVAGESVYADNGIIPDGGKVAYLLANADTPASLTSDVLNAGLGLFQSVDGHDLRLVAGQHYRLRFRYNAAEGAGSFDPARMGVAINSSVLANNLTVNPVGGGSDYYTFDQQFTATTSGFPSVSISNVDIGSGGKSVLLLDDISILKVTPEPTAISFAALFAPLVIRKARQHHRT